MQSTSELWETFLKTTMPCPCAETHKRHFFIEKKSEENLFDRVREALFIF